MERVPAQSQEHAPRKERADKTVEFHRQSLIDRYDLRIGLEKEVGAVSITIEDTTADRKIVDFGKNARIVASNSFWCDVGRSSVVPTVGVNVLEMREDPHRILSFLHELVGTQA
ncbi:MAG: hypothetical protein A3I44_06165 [Candidatus Sungbacteria bacterium RIFCSPLOWO2_02_FULL_51_17]|uniref:Uncharacterized protein n=1 Tax=Candidatus Sungbacteria bacterium RIFCSPHIGHO2_02_FULL_51_29 TaxID=1802273 RepID=A0A1G2KSP5_9BACT|nr:MAG: hypothetical protein A2676_04480 [Candidatus Sungbacteria bacterium RIFCSPHIGHO2_01_FULL_51_22]OHA01612.1 MAG: hypothetical protein A3C16_02540 [Candidatus Sungbacteria bacterium RIFCSPHIGHO2_02_FULL_51_29]OHA06424.1 MAG: hypothetical protein A3B29_04630 [Candidatus Sungbacteria bacterium RIFCSPLOWO2_01_FULL_51_34]OHA10362.1 MAG: hypothetical protein A3I44_06165 [Candidatus Sungbacteria bacterium RIFCSPLOWO2_02_FULL_51_17]